MNASTSTPAIQPYLFFSGNCEKAIAFYRKALGAEVLMMMRFKEAPDQPPPGTLAPGFEEKIMHSSFRVGGSLIMASDGCGPEEAGFKGFSLSLSVTHEADADRYFNALAEGGKVTMPLTKTFWSPKFGMLEDQFGIGWMVNVTDPAQAG